MTASSHSSANLGARSAVLMVWLAVVIFASASSVVRVLSDIGAAHPIDGRNAITFCNILFAGNACACAILFVIFRKQWTRETLRAMTRSDWAALALLAILSTALAPSMIFLALENTTVTNVVLVGRIEPVLLLALSVAFTAERIDRWAGIGALIALVGVALIIASKARGTEAMIGRGELFAVLGAAALAVSTMISRKRLTRIPLGIFAVFRTGLGAVIFFIVAGALYGPSHFMDVVEPYLWRWMLIYGGVVVVVGQLAWFTGIKRCATAQASLAASFSPVAGVGFAVLLLGERPDWPTLIGGAVIVAGILVARFGGQLISKRSSSAPAALEQEGQLGFKGV